MTVLLEIVDDDHLTRLNHHQKPPRRGWALQGGALYKDRVLIGALCRGLVYEMKPRSTDLVVELRYTPIRELLNGKLGAEQVVSGAIESSGPAALERPGPGTEGGPPMRHEGTTHDARSDGEVGR